MCMDLKGWGQWPAEDFLKELGLRTPDAEEFTQAIHFGKGLKVQEMEKRNLCINGHGRVYVCVLLLGMGWRGNLVLECSRATSCGGKKHLKLILPPFLHLSK